MGRLSSILMVVAIVAAILTLVLFNVSANVLFPFWGTVGFLVGLFSGVTGIFAGMSGH